MILAIDCGNTNTVFALYTVNNQINQLASWRINNDSKRTADLYYPWLLKMFEISKFNITSVTGISVASVVPETLVNIKSLIKKYFNVKTLIVNENILDLGVKVNIDNPKEAGADRLVNAYAAEKLKISPAIIIDFGTAVPKSIIIAGEIFNFSAAYALTNLSAPASFGLSIFTFTPKSRMFSLTINVLTLKYFLIKDFIFTSVSGTTDATDIPVTEVILNLDISNIFNNQG